MKNETQFRALIVILSISLIIIIFEYFEKDRVYQELKVSTSKQMDSLRNITDSLYDENFIKSVEIGRNDLTWEYVKEKFPNVYNNAMNFNQQPFTGDNGSCSKYRWATGCGVTWDGITSGVKNPCDTSSV